MKDKNRGAQNTLLSKEQYTIGLTWGHFSDSECAVKNKCCTVSSVAAPPRHPTPSILNTSVTVTVLLRESVGARECGFAIDSYVY